MVQAILISDLDGTLCFHDEQHGVRQVQEGASGRVWVEDGDGGQRYLAHDVSTSAYRIYVAEQTLELLRGLARHVAVVLVTGARPSTMRRRQPLFPFARAMIVESGGLILGPDGTPDREWWERLEPERRALAGTAQELERLGWKLDADGRTSALRVRHRDNAHKSRAEFEKLCESHPLPPELKRTKNLDNLDIILRSAGKAEAVRYWRDANRLDHAPTYGIGDDVNDLDFLAEASHAFVLASAYPEALEAARRGGWTVSQRGGIAGIHEILEALLARVAGGDAARPGAQAPSVTRK